LVEQVEFVPCRQPLTYKIGAKAQRMTLTDDLLRWRRRAEIDDRTTFGPRSKSLVTTARENLGRSLDRSGQSWIAKNRRWHPGLRQFRESPCAAMEPFWLMVRTLLASSKWVSEFLPAIRPAHGCNIRKYASHIHFGSADRSRWGRFRWVASGDRQERLADVSSRLPAVPAEALTEVAVMLDDLCGLDAPSGF